MTNDFSAPEGAPARRVADTDGVSDSAGPARRAAEPRRGFSSALGWTALGTLIPGLGLIRAGRRVAGGIVLGLFVVLIGGVIGLVLVNRKMVENFVLGTQGAPQALAVALLVLALIWVVVIGVTHLALRPSNPSVGQRAAGAAVVGLLSFVVAAPMAVGANIAWTTGDTLDKIIGADDTPNSTQPTIDVADPWANKDRLNFLIIGGDSGTGRSSSEGDRTDTVIVASIDTHTGATTLFTLPRNTEKMPFPPDSPLHKYYPNGFTSGSTDLYTRSQFLLNAMYRVVPTKVPHDILGKTKDFGASVMKVSVGYALGLKIDYFVKVNMDGFKDFINAIGGIRLNVNYPIPVGGQTDAGIKPDYYLKVGPNQLMKGHDALWYARGRYGLDDYKRMERQRCVINAVVQQTTPDKVLANFQDIAKAGENTITTDVPRNLLSALVDLGVKVKNTKLRSVVFTPGDAGFQSYDPNWTAVRARVQKALKETEKGVDATPSATATANSSTSPSATASPTKSSTSKAKSDDLEDTCAYHPEK
ncbi:MAG: LCP family protein [Actinobacteria bacterium]|nr:LCP family protein [Actinomycetota bacterium]